MTYRLFTCETLSGDEETRHQSQLLRLLWRGALYETPSLLHFDEIARSLRVYNINIAQNAEFTAAALEFPQAVIFAAEFLSITPSFMKPLVASIATNRHRAAKTLYQYLVPIVEQRLAMRDLQPHRVTPVRWEGCPWSPTA